MFSVADLQDAELVPPLPNSKGSPVLRTRGHGSYISPINFGTKLYHVADDPRQKDPVDNAEIEARMAKLLKEEMAKADAPAEQFVRLGLEGEITPESILSQRESETLAETPDLIPGAAWTKEAKNVLRAFSKMMPKEGLQGLAAVLSGIHTANPEKPVSYDDIVQAAKAILPKDQADRTVYYMYMISRAE